MTETPTPPPSTVTPTETPATPETPAPKREQEISNPKRQVYSTRKPRFSEANPGFGANLAKEMSFGGRQQPAPPEAPSSSQEAPAAQETPEAQATPEKAPEGQPEAKEEPPAAEAKPEAKEAEKEPDPAEAKELSKRMAKLVKQEQALAAEKQRLAQEREAIQRENARHQQINQTFKVFQDEIKADPVGAIRKHLGITPDDYLAAVFGEQPKTPAAPPAPPVDPRIEQLEQAQKEIKEAYLRQQRESVNKQVSDYKHNIGTHLQANQSRYQLLLADQGDNAANEVWALMQVRYKQLVEKHGDPSRIPQDQIPTLEQAAGEIESYLKGKADTYAKALGNVSSPAPKSTPDKSSTEATPKAATPVANTNNVAKTQIKHSDVARDKAKPPYKVRPHSF